MARAQSPGDREAALKAMVETLMAQTRELQARLDSAGETIARLQRMVFGSRSERIVLSTGGSPLLPGFERMMGEAAGKDEPAKDEPAKDGAVGRAQAPRPARGGLERAPPGSPPGDRRHRAAARAARGAEARRPRGEREARPPAGVRGADCQARQARPRGQPPAGVVTAPAPRVAACVAPDSDRCRHDLSVIVHVIAARLRLHLPLRRQSAALARMGVRHGRSAMCGHFARVSEALRPLHGHMVSLILACPVLHADETSVRMLPSSSGMRPFSVIFPTRVAAVNDAPVHSPRKRRHQAWALTDEEQAEGASCTGFARADKRLRRSAERAARHRRDRCLDVAVGRRHVAKAPWEWLNPEARDGAGSR